METVEAQYEVSEVSYVLVDAPVVERAGRSLASPPPRYALPPVEPAATAEPAGSLVDRIQVDFALHEAGACHGSGITVSDLPGGRLAVRGAVDTEDRKQQLVEALNGLPAVAVIEISTAEEAARLVPSGAQLAAERPRLVLRSTSFALEKPLHGYFLRSGTRQAAGDRRGLLIDSLRAGSAGAAREAAALRRLADAYPAGTWSVLPAGSRRLLLQMIGGHGRRLVQDLNGMRGSLTTVAEALGLEPAGGEPPLDSGSAGAPLTWDSECQSLPAAVRELETRIWDLLANSAGAAEGARALALEAGRSLQSSRLQAERLVAAAGTLEESVTTAGNNRKRK
jgi:hypothetical protein